VPPAASGKNIAVPPATSGKNFLMAFFLYVAADGMLGWIHNQFGFMV
jgi:arginine decarboxylase-like protein